jgi:hypothetical protein
VKTSTARFDVPIFNSNLVLPHVPGCRLLRKCVSQNRRDSSETKAAKGMCSKASRLFWRNCAASGVTSSIYPIASSKTQRLTAAGVIGFCPTFLDVLRRADASGETGARLTVFSTSLDDYTAYAAFARQRRPRNPSARVHVPFAQKPGKRAPVPGEFLLMLQLVSGRAEGNVTANDTIRASHIETPEFRLAFLP